MKIARQRYRRFKVADLTPHPRNPRRGNVPAIRASIQRNDFVGAVIVQRSSGFVIAGRHRLEAAIEEGAKEVPGLEVDVDDETALRILLADNRTSDLAGYDEAALLELLRDVGQEEGTLEGTAWTFDDFRKLEREQAKLVGDLGDEGELPEIPAEPVSKLGEVYELGRHRLLCGDAFSDEAAAFYSEVAIDAVLTDPPYGIGLVADWSSLSGSEKATWHKPGRDWTVRPRAHETDEFQPHGESKAWEPVPGDDRPFDATAIVAMFAYVREQFWFGADYYRRTLSEYDLDGSYLVWDKRNESTDAVMGSGFELIWSRQAHKRDLLRHYFLGSYGVEAREREHPTQKPTPLLAEILTRWTPAEAFVADPFLGAGSTLIACERTGRTCYGVELEPRYCDVIRARYERLAG